MGLWFDDYMPTRGVFHVHCFYAEGRECDWDGDCQADSFSVGGMEIASKT